MQIQVAGEERKRRKVKSTQYAFIEDLTAQYESQKDAPALRLNIDEGEAAISARQRAQEGSERQDVSFEEREGKKTLNRPALQLFA